jgi:hypothetical protein
MRIGSIAAVAVVFAVTVVVVLAVTAGIGSAHGWAVDADPQVVGDDVVVVGHVSMLEGGYLAVHVVEDGEPGPVLGTVHFEERGEHDDVEVELDGAAWADVEGTVRLVAVVHGDDGDGEFDWPDGDPVFRPDDPVVDRFVVRKSRGESARVVGRRQDTEGNVTVRRVDIPADGFLVLYDDDDGERGEVVGVERLPAGHHEDVAVSVAPRYYNDEGSFLFLIAGLHRDDGDGEFQPESDPAVAVDGSAVTASFDANKQRPTIPTPTPTASPTATRTPTQTATPTATEAPAGQSPNGSPTGRSSPTPTMVDEPGFGSMAALGGLLLLAVRLWTRHP